MMSNYILTGHWKFNQTLVFTSDITAEINFLFGENQEASRIDVNDYSDSVDYYGEDDFYERVYWVDESYAPDNWGGRTDNQHIRFVTPQTVNEDFYDWFIANATLVSFIIPVTSNGTTTLATEGKYCDRNIDVVVSVPASVDTEMEDAIVTGTVVHYANDRVTHMGSYAMADRTQLKTLDLPMAEMIGSRAFQGCRLLKTVNLPKVETIASYGFYQCAALETVDLPVARVIGAQAFNGTNLGTLVLRQQSVAALNATTAFSDTPIASGTGFVYVPDALVDSYKAATNWSKYADQIKPISVLEENT